MTSLIARLTLLGCLLSGVLLGVMMQFAKVTSLHPSLITYNTCALPCLFGVMPGASQRDDAMIRFDEAKVSYSYYNPVGRTYPTHESTHPPTLMAYMYFGDPFLGDVRSLQLFQTSGVRNLGYLSDFMLAGYQPAHVWTACQDETHALITVNDQDWFLQVTLDSQIRPDAAVLLISVASDPDVMTRSLDNFGCAAESDWMGFAPQWKYQTVS